jgi:hypothetical protein
VAELPLALSPSSTVVVAISSIPVAVLCLGFVLGQRDAEESGCGSSNRDLQGVTARRCLRQRFGEEIEPSFIHVRHSSWRLEPLPLIITGTLLAYAISTNRKRETGTSGFMFW